MSWREILAAVQGKGLKIGETTEFYYMVDGRGRALVQGVSIVSLPPVSQWI